MSPVDIDLQASVGKDDVLHGRLVVGPQDGDPHGLARPGLVPAALAEAMALVLRAGDLSGRLEGLELHVAVPPAPGAVLAIQARQVDFLAARIALEASATGEDGTTVATATATFVPLPDH